MLWRFLESAFMNLGGLERQMSFLAHISLNFAFFYSSVDSIRHCCATLLFALQGRLEKAIFARRLRSIKKYLHFSILVHDKKTTFDGGMHTNDAIDEYFICFLYVTAAGGRPIISMCMMTWASSKLEWLVLFTIIAFPSRGFLNKFKFGTFFEEILFGHLRFLPPTVRATSKFLR